MMHEFFLQRMTNDIGFTFSVGHTTWEVYNYYRTRRLELAHNS